MSRHVLDETRELGHDAPLRRYARAARAQLPAEKRDRMLMALSRKAKGPWNPAARMRAFLRIERGYSA